MFKRKNKKTPNLDRRNAVNADRPKSGPVVRYYQPVRGSEVQKRRKHAPFTSLLAREDEPNQRSVLSRIRSFIVRMSQWALFAVIIFTVFANITLSGASVSIKAGEQAYRTQSEYQQGTEEVLSGSVTNRTKLTISSRKVENSLLEKFPELQSANVVTPLAGRKLDVDLTVAPPLLRLLVSANKMAVVSDAGVVIRSEDIASIESRFAKYPSLSVNGIDIKEGAQLLTSTELELIRLLLKEFDGSESFRPKVQSIEYEVKKREIRARFGGVTYYAKMTPERESRPQIGALLRTITYLSDGQGGGVPKEYIDVRVDDRVFVR